MLLSLVFLLLGFFVSAFEENFEGEKKKDKKLVRLLVLKKTIAIFRICSAQL